VSAAWFLALAPRQRGPNPQGSGEITARHIRHNMNLEINCM
jgi:hypothetical protein